MKFWGIIIVLLFVAEITLAQKPGVISDSIICKRSPDQSYALYLPNSYSASSPAGVILFLDPGAEGKYPVDLYKSIADKYSLILAGSNNSRNGSILASQHAANSVLEDVLSRFNVDRKFIITSGFSGGARMAVHIAGINKNVTGVIACGAAFNNPDAIKMEKPIPFVEVIGQLEMNYQEALRARDYLQAIHNPSSLIFFYGYHQWPPADAYKDAVDWHQLRTYNKPDTQREVTAKTLKLAQVKIDSGYMNEASHILKQMLGTKPVDSLFAIVKADSRTRPQIKQAAKMDEYERRVQEQFLYAYNQHIAHAAPDTAYHPLYWKGFLRDCEKLITGDRYKKLAGLRLIDFGWHRCSENYFNFMEEEQYRQAAMSARIFALIRPTWARPCVMAARAFALQKRKTETFDYLRQAVARGFKDQKGLMADPAFAEYSRTEEFKKIFN